MLKESVTDASAGSRFDGDRPRNACGGPIGGQPGFCTAFAVRRRDPESHRANGGNHTAKSNRPPWSGCTYLTSPEKNRFFSYRADGTIRGRYGVGDRKMRRDGRRDAVAWLPPCWGDAWIGPLVGMES